MTWRSVAASRAMMAHVATARSRIYIGPSLSTGARPTPPPAIFICYEFPRCTHGDSAPSAVNHTGANTGVRLSLTCSSPVQSTDFAYNDARLQTFLTSSSPSVCLRYDAICHDKPMRTVLWIHKIANFSCADISRIPWMIDKLSHVAFIYQTDII